MKFNYAQTYKYEMKHFNKLLDLREISGYEEGRCFNNSILFAEEYKKLGRNVEIVLAYIANDCSDNRNNYFGSYHYLLRDVETNEYIDPQYWRCALFTIHSWSLEEYKEEQKVFKQKYGFGMSSEFFAYYYQNNIALFKTAITLLKQLNKIRFKLDHNEFLELVDSKPNFGKQELLQLESEYYYSQNINLEN